MKNSLQDSILISYVRGQHRWLFLCFDDEAQRRQLLKLLGQYALDPELEFHWIDACVVASRVRGRTVCQQELME